mmetsp:Transcript_36241/g.90466  ORF Transcript_36241/g.90466 Transcript_36241/m.90466 type:complete len:246 (-) Transcript_36241:328-1065(-)
MASSTTKRSSTTDNTSGSGIWLRISTSASTMRATTASPTATSSGSTRHTSPASTSTRSSRSTSCSSSSTPRTASSTTHHPHRPHNHRSHRSHNSHSNRRALLRLHLRRHQPMPPPRPLPHPRKKTPRSMVWEGVTRAPATGARRGHVTIWRGSMAGKRVRPRARESVLLSLMLPVMVSVTVTRRMRMLRRMRPMRMTTWARIAPPVATRRCPTTRQAHRPPRNCTSRARSPTTTPCRAVTVGTAR